MSTSESTPGIQTAPASAAPAGALSPAVRKHGFHKVLHNSWIVCWVTIAMGPLSALLGVFMIVEAGMLIFPVRGLDFMRILAAIQWGFSGFSFMLMLHPLWIWGRNMLYKKVILDDQGVDFHLGTPQDPAQVFIPWNEIQSIEQGRTYGHNWQVTVRGRDGAYAQYTALTFFRPRHVAKVISQRSGVPITKV